MAKEATKPSCTLADLVALGTQPLKIGDHIIGYVNAKEFTTGSIGLSFTGKYHLPLGDNKVAYLQCSANFTVIGSKKAAAAEKQEEVAA